MTPLLSAFLRRRDALKAMVPSSPEEEKWIATQIEMVEGDLDDWPAVAEAFADRERGRRESFSGWGVS